MEDRITMMEKPLFELFPGTYCFKIETDYHKTQKEHSIEDENYLKLNKGSLITEGKDLIVEPVYGCKIDLDQEGNIDKTSLQNEEKLFICYYCAYSSDWRKLFVKHMKNHQLINGEFIKEEKMLKNATLAVLAVAKLQDPMPTKYQRNRISGKLYSCSFCNYKAMRADILKVHQRIHSGEKPYACRVCNYKATTSSLLNIHLRVHSGEKPYACSLCSYKATTSNNLSIHQRSHSGVKPYACSICSYKSTTSSALKRHVKRVHR